MQESPLRPVSAWRRRAAFWSLPVLAAALGLLSPAGAQAQRDNERGSTAAPTTSTRDVRLSRLIGMEVRNPRGEDIGEIQDLVVDVNNQRVHYAVLAFGGFLGMGEKLFAYPMRLFRQSADRDRLVLNVSREQLREWPSFERNRWPDWSEDRYRSEVERYHGGGAVQVQPRANMRLVRASDLIDRDIDDPRGRDAGEIEDIVVNLRDGSLRYVVMEFDRAWNPNDKLVTLPMTAFTFPARGDGDLRLNVERERLEAAPGFEGNRWPDVNDPAWRRENERWLGGLGRRDNTRDAAGNEDRPR